MAMRKIGLIVLALLLFAGLASAQVPTSVNVFFGYSYYNASALPVETGRSNLNGWEGTFEGKIIPWVGMVADCQRTLLWWRFQLSPTCTAGGFWTGAE